MLLENEVIVSAAVIAAQATLGTDGFRQRDVRFYVGVFSNWLEATTGSWTLELHNAQMQRHLELLVKAGLAKRPGRTPPRYRLTAEGLLTLLERLGKRRNLRRMDELFFVVHLFHAYGGRLKALVVQSGALASRSLSVDLDALLDPSALIERERALVARERKRLEIRIDESRRTAALTRELLQRGKPLAVVIEEVEARFPYELNSQKPLKELFEELPMPFRRLELETMPELRADLLWEPTRALLEGYDRILDSLSKQQPNRAGG